MSNETNNEVQAVKDELFSKRQHAAVRMDAGEMKSCDQFCAEYMDFMNTAKTEREAAAFFSRTLEENGYVSFKPGMALKAGDKVVFSKYAGTDVKYEGEEYTIMSQGDILAVVE